MLNIIKLLAVINKTKLLKMWWILALPWYRNPKWWFLFLLPKGWSWKLIEFSRSLWIYDKTKNIFDFYCHLWDTGVAHDRIVLKHSNCRYKLSYGRNRVLTWNVFNVRVPSSMSWFAGERVRKTWESKEDVWS